MAISPINTYRVSPPVDAVGDKQLERSRREFLDLIKSDERKHEGNARQGQREQQSNLQRAGAQETERQSRLADNRVGGREAGPAPKSAAPVQRQPQREATSGPPTSGPPSAVSSKPGLSAPASEPSVTGDVATQALRMSPTARAMLQGQITPVTRRDPEARENNRGNPSASQSAQSMTAAAPNRPSGLDSARHPNPIGGPPPPEARPRSPEPPTGSSLVAPAAEAGRLNLVPAPTTAPTFRLSSEVPREVADRIAGFMRTGSLDRKPFSFGQVAPVVDLAEPVLTPEQQADQAVASLLAKSAPHMRFQAEIPASDRRGVDKLGLVAQMPGTALPGQAAALAAMQAHAALQPQKLVTPVAGRKPGIVPDQQPSPLAASFASPGEANPLFGPETSIAPGEDLDDDDVVIDLIAGPRWDTRRDRIA